MAVVQNTLIAAGTRTSTTSSSASTNPILNTEWIGATFTLRVTAITGTGIRFNLIGIDATGGEFTVNDDTTITSTGVYQFKVFPGASGTEGAAEQSSNTLLPAKFVARVTHTDGNSITYAVDGTFY